MSERFRFRSSSPALLLVLLVSGCAIDHRSALDFLGTPAEVSSISDWPGASLLGFSRPELPQPGAGLHAITPFDPAKIPVVLVHGLLSDPGTWDEMLQGLRQDAEVESHFQFWTFRYSTGSSYLSSAADLRSSLQDAITQLDHPEQASRLDQMVLIGHSMGGLLSKLQVTHSDDTLWNAVARKPIEQLELDAGARETLRDTLYFEPQPMIRRVIYIGVPHGGSTWSQNPIGKFGEQIIQYPRKLQDNYRRILHQNSEDLLVDPASGVPTSIDHLSPDSPILQATRQLRLGAGVQFHSIIGNADRLPDGSPGDSIVAVDSAQIAGARSVWYVPATHTELHRIDESIREVKRILLEHLTKLPPLNEPPAVDRAETASGA